MTDTSLSYETTITVNCYQIANLRWLLRYCKRLSQKSQMAIDSLYADELAPFRPEDFWFDTGDWFGEMSYILIDAAKRVLPHKPNSSNDAPTSYDANPDNS
jgi:hypothetical protein